MPEIRQDPTTREWVIIATERAKRPHELHPFLPQQTKPAVRVFSAEVTKARHRRKCGDLKGMDSGVFGSWETSFRP